MIIIAVTTPNYGLHVTPESDVDKKVLDWRTEQAGDGADSNMMKLDSIIKDIQDNSADVLEFELYSQLPQQGKGGKIYIIFGDTTELNGQYRWTGTVYSSISSQISFATKEEAEAGENNSKAMTALRSKEVIESLKSKPNGVAGTDADNKVFPEQLPTNLLTYGNEEISSVVTNDADTLGRKTVEEIEAYAQSKADEAERKAKEASRPSTWTPSAADVRAVGLGDDIVGGIYISVTNGDADRTGFDMGYGVLSFKTNEGSSGGKVQVKSIADPTDPADAANKQYVDGKQLVFVNKAVAVSAWAANSTYSTQGYAFRASVTCAGVTASHRPDVAFGAADAVSGNFAPVVDSYAGGVYIYCKTKPTATVTIPSIVCVKGA